MIDELENIKIEITPPAIKIKFDGKQIVIDERELLRKGFRKSSLVYLRGLFNGINMRQKEIMEAKFGEHFALTLYDIQSNKECMAIEKDFDIVFEYEYGNIEDDDYCWEKFRMANGLYYFPEGNEARIFLCNYFLQRYISNGKYIDINGETQQINRRDVKWDNYQNQ